MSYQLLVGMVPLFGPCMPADLDAAEMLLGFPLSDDYREFLLEWNGVNLVGSYAAFLPRDRLGEDEDDAGELSLLFGVKQAPHQEDWELVQNQTGYAFNQRVPRGIIAIGADRCWNRICINIADGLPKGIYWWSPGLPGEEGPNKPIRKYLHPVADTFREFWNMLYPAPPIVF